MFVVVEVGCSDGGGGGGGDCGGLRLLCDGVG